MTHDADKLIRQLSLVAYLMAEQRPVTARDVKNNVEGYANMGDEAFARRYYADRAELQGLGVPITSGRDEFTGEELYTLREEQYFLPPIDLNDQELAALLNCLGMLDGQFAYAEPLRLALQNLALGRHVSADPGSDSVRVNLLGSVYTPEIAQRLAKLELAISKQRTVRFSYRSLGGGERRERQINPYGLFELNSVWYVIGDDLEVPEEEPRRKTYRVSRMGSEIKFATRRERDFRIPADFDVNAYRDRLSWQLGDETEGEAVLWIAPDSTFVARRLYGRRSEITEHDDGSATLVTDYTDLEPLSQLVLQHLGQVRPVEPPELARMVEKDLKRIVRLHKGRPSHATPEPPPRALGTAELGPCPGAGRTGAIRAAPGAARVPARAVRRRDVSDRFLGGHPRSLPAHARTSSRSTSTCSTWSTSAAAATRSTARRTTARCTSTRSCTATPSAVRRGCRRSRRRR